MTYATNWLISIGLTSAAFATLLAVAAWAASRFWRRPALAHMLWVVVLLKLVTPPLVQVPIGWKIDASLCSQSSAPSLAANKLSEQTIASPSGPRAIKASSQPLEIDWSAGEAVPINADTRPPTPSEPWTNGIRPTGSMAIQTDAVPRRASVVSRLQAASVMLAKWLPAIWLVGIAVSLFVLLRRAWHFHRFIQRVGNVDPSLSRRVQQLARQAGLTRAPQVIAVQGAVSPMLWGAGGAIRLIFPAQLAGSLSSRACDTLLLHELAHYSRGDQWVRLVELATQVLYWWHPVAWWARREIEAAEEQCCDAWVVERQSGPPRCYAEALLATIDFLCEQPALLPPAASGLGDVPMLRLRLTQIMCGNVAAGLPAGVKTAVLVIALFILPLGPALFGASVHPKLLPRTTPATVHADATIGPINGERTTAPLADSPSDLPLRSPIETSLATPDLPAAVRPPAVVTAAAVSRNGKYRLERRKGSHVTLVNQATDWRLDMSTHGILCVAFTPDSRSFVTGHADGQVRVWDSETGGLAATLRGCTDAVWSIAVSPNAEEGYQIAAGAKDGSVIVWDLASGEEAARLPPAEVSVSCLRWSQRGDKLAISFGDFSDRDQAGLLIWSPADNVLLSQATLERPAAALAWLPGDDRLVVADWNGEAAVLPGSGTPRYRLLFDKGDKKMAEAAHWSADCPLVPAWLADELAAAANPSLAGSH